MIEPHSEVLIAAADASSPIPVHLVAEGDLDAALAAAGPNARALAEAGQFKARSGQVLTIAGADGRTERVLFGIGKAQTFVFTALRALSSKLAPGDYSLPASTSPGSSPISCCQKAARLSGSSFCAAARWSGDAFFGALGSVFAAALASPPPPKGHAATGPAAAKARRSAAPDAASLAGGRGLRDMALRL